MCLIKGTEDLSGSGWCDARLGILGAQRCPRTCVDQQLKPSEANLGFRVRQGAGLYDLEKTPAGWEGLASEKLQGVSIAGSFLTSCLFVLS